MKEKHFPGVGRTILTVLIHPGLLSRGIRCFFTILYKFFLFQYCAAHFLRLPVSRVDNALDDVIPFNPGFVRIYLDFTAFWIRIAGFLSIGYGKKGRRYAADFISSITNLYSFTFQIYRKNLSTTARPLYKKGFHFRLIHLVDPHLMCIPSLHVMLVAHSYAAFRYYLRCLGETETQRMLEEKVFNGALAITEAVLYVKQHSINCIAATFYTMNCFNSQLFTIADAEKFMYSLFKDKTINDIPKEYVPYYSEPFVCPDDIVLLRDFILNLYRHFTEKNNDDWTVPIFEFLKTFPLK